MAYEIDRVRMGGSNESYSTVTLGEDLTTVGQFVAIKTADGEAYAATDASGQTVVGINAHKGSEGDELVVLRGIYRFENSATQPVTAAYIGKTCYIENSTTVAISTVSSNKAGTVRELDGLGVFVDVGVITAI